MPPLGLTPGAVVNPNVLNPVEPVSCPGATTHAVFDVPPLALILPLSFQFVCEAKGTVCVAASPPLSPFALHPTIADVQTPRTPGPLVQM